MRTKNTKARQTSNYTPWIVGAVLAVLAILGIMSYSGSGLNVASNDAIPKATSPVTTTGSGTGSSGISGAKTPATPAPRR